MKNLNFSFSDPHFFSGRSKDFLLVMAGSMLASAGIALALGGGGTAYAISESCWLFLIMALFEKTKMTKPEVMIFWGCLIFRAAITITVFIFTLPDSVTFGG